jgi:hypothetical protein
LGYLHTWRILFHEVGFIQLDNMYSEAVLSENFHRLGNELVNRPDGLEKIATMRDEFSKDISFASFVSQIPSSYPGYPDHPKTVVYNNFKNWLTNLRSKPELNSSKQEIIDAGERFHYLVKLELNLTYKLFYGDRHIKDYYRRNCLPHELLKYLEEKHPEYYRRVEKLHLI